MAEGLGIDIVEIQRIRQLHERYGDRFLQRLFSTTETTYAFSRRDPYPHLAARFAAKEALIKAGGGQKPLSWTQMEVRLDSRGKPSLYLEGSPSPSHLVSLSHTADYAVAVVWWKGNQ
jgi:holo-[acyl-carrier protein] synthase